MKLNVANIRSGDVFFIRSFSPIGLLIQFVTGIFKPTHTGIILKDHRKQGLYVIEMVADFTRPKKNALLCRPINIYFSRWKFWQKLISIKRAPEGILSSFKEKFTYAIADYLKKKQEYDYQEGISFITDKKDDSPKLICSRFVYELHKKCGVDFKLYQRSFDILVSPADLYNCKIYNEVDWKL
ncbi:MAG: hypothetical protein ACFFDN_00910 [Candidatus Hodarchaeota archaeon]